MICHHKCYFWPQIPPTNEIPIVPNARAVANVSRVEESKQQALLTRKSPPLESAAARVDEHTPGLTSRLSGGAGIGTAHAQ